MKKIVVATHGHCFDGLCSAVVFTDLLRKLEPEPLEFSYIDCGYSSWQKKPTPDALIGDQNAILDYRFTATDKLTWYFDHHRTAFASQADRDFFESRKHNGRYFFDPEYTSCTKFIRDLARTEFNVDTGALDDLVQWADVIDSASFACPKAATDHSSPVMQLVSVVEHYGNDKLITRLVGELLSRPLSEVAASETVQRRYKPLGKRHERFVAAVRECAREQGRVVMVDLTDRKVDLLGKFVTYALYPQSVYSVVAARLKRGYKIAVGYNPWCGQALDTDISSICARYGGGGHQVVGGISLPEDQGERAADIAGQIARELDGAGTTASGALATPV